MKNINGVSVANKGQENQSIEVTVKIGFIAQTMITLTNYGEKLKKQLKLDLI